MASTNQKIAWALAFIVGIAAFPAATVMDQALAQGPTAANFKAAFDPVKRETRGGKRSAREKRAEYTKWVEKSLMEMQTIKAGMTRAQLLKVFTEEGGISCRTQQSFVYRGCPYFKVDVEFEPVGNLQDKLTKIAKDKIAKISKPYLQWSIED